MTEKQMWFGLVLALFFVVMLGKLPTTNASNYYPPRIQQICWDNYYGVDWDIARKQEKRCRVLWNSWTYAENNHLPY